MTKVTDTDINRSYLVLSLLRVSEAACEIINNGTTPEYAVQLVSAIGGTIRHVRELVGTNHDVLEIIQTSQEDK